MTTTGSLTSGTAGWSADEQAGTRGASPGTLAALADLNARYRARFGFVYLVCATGKSADDMLATLRERLAHDPADELAVAAAEQRAITRIRLEKWLTQ